MIAVVQLNLPLQVGSRLENYRILRVLAAGGFSFVYLAHDENDAPVAIKEYLPATLALRTNGSPQAHLKAQQQRAGLARRSANDGDPREETCRRAT